MGKIQKFCIVVGSCSKMLVNALLKVRKVHWELLSRTDESAMSMPLGKRRAMSRCAIRDQRVQRPRKRVTMVGNATLVKSTLDTTV